MRWRILGDISVAFQMEGTQPEDSEWVNISVVGPLVRMRIPQDTARNIAGSHDLEN